MVFFVIVFVMSIFGSPHFQFVSKLLYPLAIIAFLFLGGCSSEPPQLEGVVNADKIPVFPQATLDPEQAIAGAELDFAFYVKYWDLNYKAPIEDVVAFYRQALPDAIEKTEDGITTFHWEFPGAESGEYIEISISPGVIHAQECLKLGKHESE